MAGREELPQLRTGVWDILAAVGISVVAIMITGIGSYGPMGILLCLVFLVILWGLAEFFTRRRQMALCSLALLGWFAYFLMGATVGIVSGRLDVDNLNATVMAVTFIGIVAHYARFRVPASVALAACAFGLFALIGLGIAAPSFAHRYLYEALLVLGLAILVLAIGYDVSDRRRDTRRADIAMWLYLVAAPISVLSLGLVLGKMLRFEHFAAGFPFFLAAVILPAWILWRFLRPHA
jgi:hypothetical protein